MAGYEQTIGQFQNLTFVANDVEATVRELKARGVEITRDARKED